jgi:N-acetylneuraminic acid mutarotase
VISRSTVNFCIAIVAGCLGSGLTSSARGADGGGQSVLLDSAWKPVGSMSTARTAHVSAVTRGRWFVGGGGADTSGNFLASVEVYDPAIGSWQKLVPLMTGRTEMGVAADSLSGKVLFAGGKPPNSLPYYATGEADLGDGTAWSASSLLTPRYAHAAAFAAGKYIVSGGYSTSNGQLADAESMDSGGSSWTSAGTMPSGPRSYHAMTTLADGHTVLVSGGSTGQALASADLFDAVTGTWRKASSMQVARVSSGVVLLQDERVLVTGGESGIPNLASCEIYSPASDSWSPAASMQSARSLHSAVLLPDGRVLVAGGSNDGAHVQQGALGSVEIYDPKLDSWIAGPSLHDRRVWQQAAVLADGVYVTGGENQSSQVLASTERLAFVTPGQGDAGDDGGGGADSGGAAAVEASGTDGAGPSSSDAPSAGDTSSGYPTDGSAQASSVGTSGGCGCSTAATRENAGPLLAAFASLALAVVRERRRRNG